MRDGKHAYDGTVVVALLSLAGSAIMIGMYIVPAFSPAEQPDLVAAESVSEVH
jgi:hypothetical protein